MRLGPGPLPLAQLAPGSPCWLTSDPAVEREAQRLARQPAPARPRPLALRLEGRLGEPLRLTVKPLTLAFRDRHRALEILQLRGQLVTFPGGFDASDFGAVPGSWKVGTELLWGAALVIDFGVLLR